MKLLRSFGAATLFVLMACEGTSPTASAPKSGDEQTGEVLPFTDAPTASTANETLQESTMIRRKQPSHLSKDAPNVLIVLLDDVGYGYCETFGGEISTPTFDRIAQEGVVYNRFHTTSICSPTRASLLTGRNHTRVGSGTIAERAVDWDGYTGVIPKTAATVAEVLKEYGYHTSAFGKWHNTPATETTNIGPKDRWPNGYGFEYFYGFLGGETSQWEPRLCENYNLIEPPKSEEYHLSEDLADKALSWLSQHRSFSPDKPFLMYFAPGAVHGPHHIFKEYADKYKGKFDDGWDAYRERVFKRQKEMGIIPADAQLTPRDSTMQAWEDIPVSERAFQSKLMEIYAGFLEHVDQQVGRVINGLDEFGIKDNTIVVYVFGDNGSSAEGNQGSLSELLTQNLIPNTIQQQIDALEKIGGLDALGTPKVDNMFHAGWAWAGSTPFKSTKLVASDFGGTRNPLAISWPKKIKHDGKVRSQFHHVTDIVPTLYEAIGITPPKVVNGYTQMPIDGTSLVYTFDNPEAPEKKNTQFFDNNGSRGVYHEGWFACTFGPFIPWRPTQPLIPYTEWNSKHDVWKLYNLNEDFSQAYNVADKYPEKLAEMKTLFLEQARDNKDFPIGGGMWLRIRPEDAQRPSYTQWVFDDKTNRMPEFTGPPMGKRSTHTTIDLELDKDNANGVVFALGGAGGGVTCYLKDGYLIYDYNLMVIKHFIGKSNTRIPKGKHQLVIENKLQGKLGSPMAVNVKLDGQDFLSLVCEQTVPLAYTATETFDVATDLGSTVSLDYYAKRPYPLEGRIPKMHIQLMK